MKNPSASMTSTRTKTKTQLPPGFRFHPTDVELVQYYLKRKVLGKRLLVEVIAEVDLCKFAPWDLPAQSFLKSGDLEWYYFCRLGKYCGNGTKTKRSTDVGYWKTTGKDRPILYNSRVVGMKKTLVFHTGRAGNGCRTNWVIHEYRLEDEQLATSGAAQDLYVLCKVFEKSGPGPKNGEQRGAPFTEEEWDEDENMEISLSNSVCLETVTDGPCVGSNDHIGSGDIANNSLDTLDKFLLSILCDDDTAHPEFNPDYENSCVEPGISAQGPLKVDTSDYDGLEIFEGLENLSLPGNYNLETDLQKTLMGYDVDPSGDFLEPYIEISDFYSLLQDDERLIPVSNGVQHSEGLFS